MPNVKQAVHLGIIRTNTLADNMTVNVEDGPWPRQNVLEGKGVFILGCTSPFKAIMIDRPGMGKVKN
jgi:hypothetical protein